VTSAGELELKAFGTFKGKEKNCGFDICGMLI